LEVRTGKHEEKMRFLITDLGIEDLVLGYPWLSTFEPKFSWRNSTIDIATLPIVIRSLDWRHAYSRPTIARIMTSDEKMSIVHELEGESGNEHITIRGISTDLAVKAQQYTKEVPIPPEYQRHARVFNNEESQRFPLA
jgi:hypothetical protein